MKKWMIWSLLTTLVACDNQQRTSENELAQHMPDKVQPTNRSDNSHNSQLTGIKLIEEVKASPGKIVIPYKKYILDNGLTLILHEDDSDPLVHVDVTYHVGSAREEPGKSGFAHFFEHMMFQGSENVADEQHFKLVTEAGGTMNGTTNADRTNYFQTVPANQLEKMLWLEADRMGFLVKAVTQEKFEIQRETVKNERGQRIDNRPYGRLYETVSEALYPAGHPYSWPVIGYLEDLNRVDVNDLKAFFLRWYGPNNATLTIGGKIDVDETLAQVVKYFGSIPRGPEVTMPEKDAIVLKQDRYVSIEDNVHLPLIYMSYPTVYVRHEDEAALDLLASILGEGKTSLLYKNLIKNQLVVNASVNHPCAELACTFNLYALPHPASGKSLADVEKIIRQTLVEFEERGVTDDDLIRAKAQAESRYMFGLQSVSGKVSQLAANQTFTGNPNYIEKDIERYTSITREDVMRVYAQYIKGKSAVILSIVPNGKANMIAAKDNYKMPERILTPPKQVSADELQLRQAKDSLDRSKIPAAAKSLSVSIPEIWRDSLPNGIKILGTQSTETPTTALLFKVPAGHLFAAKEKAGIADLLAKMLNESTAQRDGESMSNELRKLGSDITITNGDHYLSISVNTLTKNLAATLALLEEKILQPAFNEADFSRVKNNAVQDIKNSKKEPGYLANRAFRQLLHEDNIAALPNNGTEETITAISLNDVKAFYEKHFKPADSQLIAVSDLPQPKIMQMFTQFKNWKGESPQLTLNLPEPKVKTGTIYLVHKDNSAQSAIRIGKRAIKYDTTGEFYRSYLMNYPLGGAFNSRINLNLREDKGYTYGAGSVFSGTKLAGQFTASAEVRADVTDKSITEFMKEIQQYYQAGATEAEMAFMRKAVNQRDALKYETPSAKLKFLARILEYGLQPDFVKQRSEIVDTITLEEINKLAQKHLNFDEMVIVVVGDAKQLKTQLKPLGLPIVDYQI
ncbi:M16 family metallopeptidase [Aliikangiella maris]|uniref:Pitrilysin family protein n=2 Tax=Aliikangiella maris TaxID=3162458 RepID=A0ABV2BY93_9GAMM